MAAAHPPIDLTSRSAGIRFRLLRPALLAAACLVAIGLLAGCFGNQEQTSAPGSGPELLAALPEGWTPMNFGRNTLFNRGESNWLSINIDDDAAEEYALFFTFDNGQVGALIYDQQTGPTGVVSPTPIPAPYQPVGTYIPYQIEPSYWHRSVYPDTVGYIAKPGTASANITLQQVQRLPASSVGEPVAGPANPNPPSGAPPTNEAIVYGGGSSSGGGSVITVLWWINAYNGYGVAQMMAPGGLYPVGSNLSGTGNQAVYRPLTVVRGLFPLDDLLARSIMCRETRFDRQDTIYPTDVITPQYQSPVRYTQSDNGIVFCDSTPSYPYYPEGVVLAFLRPPPPDSDASAADQVQQLIDSRSKFIWSGASDAQKEQMVAAIDLNGPEAPGVPAVIVRDLRTRATIPWTPTYRTQEGDPLTTDACADLVTVDGLTVRRLLFTLAHEPPGVVDGVQQTDRLAIASITDITDAVLDCSLIIPMP